MRSHNLCDITCASILLCLEGIVPLESFISAGSYNLFTSSCSESRENAFDKDILFRTKQNTPNQNIIHLWTCVLIPSIARNGFLDNSWVRLLSLDIAVCLLESLSCYIPLAEQSSYSLDQRTIQSQILGYFSSDKYRFYLMDWALSPIKKKNWWTILIAEILLLLLMLSMS